jgi:hypothetical protein
MNTTLLMSLPTSSKSGPTTHVPLSDVPEVRLELRLVDRPAKRSAIRPQPLARALRQVVARHRAVWSAPAPAPAVAATPPMSVPSQPFHLVVPALDVAPPKNDDRRTGHPILRVGSMRRETK